MKLLYLNCFSGISGDMMIGALLDAGGDFTHLKRSLEKLKLEDEYTLTVEKRQKNGITGTKFNVVTTHVNQADHDSNHHHRTYKDIVELIDHTDLNNKVKEYAKKFFKKIGEAESYIHGTTLEKVHFHEVGAIDSIIDIVGASILLDQLQIDAVYSSPVPTGSGKIKIAHGIYPVPAPATLEILKGVPLIGVNIKSELTTPTGAAFISVLAEEYYEHPPEMTINNIGYGLGTKTFSDYPNILRVMIGHK